VTLIPVSGNRRHKRPGHKFKRGGFGEVLRNEPAPDGVMRNFRGLVALTLAGAVGVFAGGGIVSAETAGTPECPGNPDALGTSRVLAVEPSVLMRVGAMQYRQSLPLADKEVVLTLDDGPLPPYSTKALDILAAQCVKATYFLIGHQASSFPHIVRRIYEEGHSIGTHTEDHPLRMKKLPIEKVRWEIDQGIADVGAALGDPKELAPFFRVPGLETSAAIEEEAAARSLIVFSADEVADDWHRRIKPKDIVARAMKRLEARGKGILLLHDIHPATIIALPELLKELKNKGFHIVHVVPASGMMVASGETAWSNARVDPVAAAILASEAAERTVLPAPDVSSFDTGYLPRQRIVVADRSATAGYLAIAAATTEWSDPTANALPAVEPALPMPSLEDFGLENIGLQNIGSARVDAPEPGDGKCCGSEPLE